MACFYASLHYKTIYYEVLFIKKSILANEHGFNADYTTGIYLVANL